MKRKLLGIILMLAILIISSLGLLACSGGGLGDVIVTPPVIEEPDEEQYKVYTAYVAYATASGETPLSYEEWLKSVKGDKGDQGEQGIQGEKGDKGDQGEQGIQGEKGDKGEDGVDGVGIASMQINDNGNLIVTMTDGTESDLGKVTSDWGFSIEEVRITENDTIAVTLGSGVVIETMPLGFAFDLPITGASINASGEFIVYLPIGDPINCGIITKAYISNNGELKLCFAEYPEISLGTIKGILGLECNHSFGEWADVCVADCATMGVKTRACASCGITEYEFVQSLCHAFGDGIVIREPIGDVDGVKLYACEVCEMAKMEVIPAAHFEIDGIVYKTDTDLDFTNNAIIEGVVINLYIDGVSIYNTVTDANGAYSIELFGGDYNVTFEKEGFIPVSLDLQVNADFDVSILETVYMDIVQSSVIKGTILEADADLDESNNSPLAGATVKLIKESGTSYFESSIESGADGKYEFEDLTAGIYKLEVSKENYVTVSQYLNVMEGQEIVQNMTLEIIPIEEDLDGIAAGYILDAAVLGNVGVEGLTLTVRAGINITTGDVVATYTSGASGRYTTDEILAGNYTVTITDERELTDENLRYGTAYFNIKVVGGETIDNQNGSVSNNAQHVDMIQIKLQWGERPYDLDSHLTGPTSSSRFHVSYMNLNVNNADLDRDDQVSYGPETTTIDLAEGVDGVYRFSVHDYSNRNSSSSTAMANSSAYVEVYMGGVLTYTFYVPDAAGTLWTVFEYDSTTGSLTAINTMSYQSNPSAIN